MIGGLCVTCRLALGWNATRLYSLKSTLVQVMVWCRQATHRTKLYWAPIENSGILTHGKLSSAKYLALGPEAMLEPCLLIYWHIESNVFSWNKSFILINTSLKFTTPDPTDNMSLLVHAVAWCFISDQRHQPLSEHMLTKMSDAIWYGANRP